MNLHHVIFKAVPTHGIEGSETMKCKVCGVPLRNPFARLCKDCKKVKRREREFRRELKKQIREFPLSF